MTIQIKDYGEPQVSKITLESILDQSNLSKEDKEILMLRFGYDWYYDKIAIHVGEKYRGRPYREGTIRYRIRRSLRKVRKVINRNKLK